MIHPQSKCYIPNYKMNFIYISFIIPSVRDTSFIKFIKLLCVELDYYV